VLTLAAHDDDYAYGSFATAVNRLSGGSLRIRIAGNWRASSTPSEIDYERGIVRDVRAGKVQLGIVGARVWDKLGVRSFQALVAPFLIDSLALEGRALQAPLARRALAEVEKAGVVGVALLPGRLRRPLGLTRPLLQPRDYRGAKIGIRPGGVAEATFRALGAHAAGYIPGNLTAFDGAELDPLTITQNNYDLGAHALTGNVVFWPKPQTIVMNRHAYDRLTTKQRQVLETAGRAAIAPELRRISRDQRVVLSALCESGLPIATATPRELAALRRAVRPVYARLEHDPGTRRWIAQIRSVHHIKQDALRCPDDVRKESSPLKGNFTGSLTRAQILRETGSKALAEKLHGSWTARLADGRFEFRDRDTRADARGTFVVHGNRVKFVFATGVGLKEGQIANYTWSIYRDRLTFKTIPGRPSVLLGFVWKRAS